MIGLARSVLFALIFSGTMVAQEGPLLSAILSAPDTLRLGDRITLTISINHDMADHVVWPDTLDTGDFELLDASFAEHTTEEGRRVAEATLELVAFDLGDLGIPPIVVQVLRPGGTEGTVSTNPINLTIESAGLDESGDIRSIKPPLGFARNWWLTVPWVLLGLVLVALAVWSYQRSRRKDYGAPQPTTTIQAAHVLAYEALDLLEHSGLLDQGKVKQFHVEVSEIARNYINGRWRINAIDMTTDDVLDVLTRVDLVPVDMERFRDLLKRSDMVKFAKYRPNAEHSAALIGLTREIVDSTRDRDEREAAA